MEHAYVLLSILLQFLVFVKAVLTTIILSVSPVIHILAFHVLINISFNKILLIVHVLLLVLFLLLISVLPALAYLALHVKIALSQYAFNVIMIII
jgi:hypothetical protein